MLLVDTFMLRGDYSILISAGLFTLNVVMVCLVLGSAARDIAQGQVKAGQLRALNKQLLVDKDEDKKKVGSWMDISSSSFLAPSAGCSLSLHSIYHVVRKGMGQAHRVGRRGRRGTAA